MKRRDFIRWSVGAGALVMLEMAGLGCSRDRSSEDLPIKLPPLPYANDALEPHLSRETIGFHYGRHHRAYVERANQLLTGSSLARRPIEAILRDSYKADTFKQTARFNNAAQAYNHAFYWNSMTPDGGGPPADYMQRWIDDAFGSYPKFKQAFADAANGHFASGWIWLVLSEGHLEIMATTNAQNPLVLGKLPLLTLDVWEHAYYLDYRNRRDEYVQAFLDHLVNWNFAAANLGEA